MIYPSGEGIGGNLRLSPHFARFYLDNNKRASFMYLC
jgi:hypothetical protein